MSKQLRHSNHPYCCAEGCYFAPDGRAHTYWGSWAGFIEEFGDCDIDMNLVWRWDWDKPECGEPETLRLFMMHQRKAFPVSHEIRIEPEDEPAVRAYLERHWATLCEMWAEVKS